MFIYCMWSYFWSLLSWFSWRSPVSKHIFQITLYSATPCNYSHLTVVTIHKHVDHYLHTHTSSQNTHTHTHVLSFSCWIQSASNSNSLPLFLPGSSYPPASWSAPAQASLCGEADATALHTDFQAI